MNRRLTIGLVVVFAALAVYVLVVQVPKDNAAANATPTGAATTYLWPTLKADQVTGVHVVDRVTGKAMDLVKATGGAWSLANPGPQPAEQSLAAQDVSSLTTLAVNSTITTSTDLASFGVLSPTLTVEVDLADGSKLKAAVGNKVPTSSDYYALRQGETQVVVLSSAAQGTLASLVTTPPVVPPTDTPTPGPGTPSVTPPAIGTEGQDTTTPGTSTPSQTAPATLTATATATLPATSTPSETATATSTAGGTGSATPRRTPTTVPKSSATP